MLIELSVEKFAQELGSNKPTPGGGSASAIVGGLAGALVQMVANLSGEEQKEMVSRTQVVIDKLLDLANRDTEAFNQVMGAFRLPRGTETEKKERSKEIQRATKVATEVPLQTMQVCLDVLVLAKEMALHGNKNAISDAGVAGLFGYAACKGASYNVLINLPSLKDQEFVQTAKKRLADILADAQKLEEFIREQMELNLS